LLNVFARARIEIDMEVGNLFYILTLGLLLSARSGGLTDQYTFQPPLHLFSHARSTGMSSG